MAKKTQATLLARTPKKTSTKLPVKAAGSASARTSEALIGKSSKTTSGRPASKTKNPVKRPRKALRTKAVKGDENYVLTQPVDDFSARPMRANRHSTVEKKVERAPRPDATSELLEDQSATARPGARLVADTSSNEVGSKVTKPNVPLAWMMLLSFEAIARHQAFALNLMLNALELQREVVNMWGPSRR